MFPRILCYFEKGVLTQSFKRSGFFSSIKNRAFKKSKSQRTGIQSSCSCACEEGIVESGVNGAALEDGEKVKVDHAGEENKEGLNGDNTNEEGESGDDWRGDGDGEEDVIDELEYIVQT